MSRLEVRRDTSWHGRTVIMIDGQDVARSVTELDLAVTPQGNRATLALAPWALVIDLEASITMSEETRRVLIEQGWTPPG